jgi:very-short-patch-repair endonuclease
MLIFVMGSEMARRLRRDMTVAESALWRLLRSRQLEGFKFRRQQPIDRYIVDFICFSHRLIVEVDGGQHGSPDQYELRRSEHLERNGFRILRFWNNEVLQNREGVYTRILEVLREPHPSPRPSPARGEGEEER